MASDTTIVLAERNDGDLDTLVATMSDPDRVGVLNALFRTPGMGSDEIAARTGLSAQTVRKHLRALMESGMVEVKERSARRGTQKLYFVVRREAWIKDDDDRTLSPRRRRNVDLGVLRRTFEDAGRAIAAPDHGKRPGRVVANVPATVDARAWQEISELQHELLGRLLAIVEEGNSRLNQSGDEPITITTALLLLELPAGLDGEGGKPSTS